MDDFDKSRLEREVRNLNSEISRLRAAIDSAKSRLTGSFTDLNGAKQVIASAKSALNV